MWFASYQAPSVIIKSRDKFISRAVDVIPRKRFLKCQVAREGILIDNEEFTNREGKRVHVSLIEITVSKRKPDVPVQNLKR